MKGEIERVEKAGMRSVALFKMEGADPKAGQRAGGLFP